MVGLYAHVLLVVWFGVFGFCLGLFLHVTFCVRKLFFVYGLGKDIKLVMTVIWEKLRLVRLSKACTVSPFWYSVTVV